MPSSSSTIVRIGTNDEWVELSTDPSLSGDDVLVFATVEKRGFRGSIDTWVIRGAWADFIVALRKLDAARHGQAALESISPGELELTIRSLDSVGHMGIEGMVGVLGMDEISLRFSTIEFDPTDLPRIVAELAAW